MSMNNIRQWTIQWVPGRSSWQFISYPYGNKEEQVDLYVPLVHVVEAKEFDKLKAAVDYIQTCHLTPEVRQGLDKILGTK